ncbi:hypothetical protein DUHN55_09280 [Helicobacter pylori]
MSSAVTEQVDEVYEGRSKTTQRLAAETQLSSIDEIIRDIADGKMVVLVDDEDRENEGDLVMAAEKMTPEAVNFMITHGRGLGHTEAGCDLAAMAGLSPVGAIIEIVGDDGEMLRLPELVKWCAHHDIRISTIERLRAYREAQMIEASLGWGVGAPITEENA